MKSNTPTLPTTDIMQQSSSHSEASVTDGQIIHELVKDWDTDTEDEDSECDKENLEDDDNDDDDDTDTDDDENKNERVLTMGNAGDHTMEKSIFDSEGFATSKYSFCTIFE